MNCIVKDIKKTENYILLTVETEKEILIEPGQFVMLKPKYYDFGKPFSVIFQEGKIIKFLIAVVGELTTELKMLKENDELDIRGAYGIPFINKIDKSKKYILLGGDCGSAPLIHFSEKYPHLVDKKIYGYATSEIRKIFNIKGLHIDEEEKMNLIEKLFKDIKFENNNAFLVCGSMDMIKSIKKAFSLYNVKIYASLEAIMGCGIGICKGCPVKTKNGIKMICKDGPIFDLSEVNLEW
ncbi:dihydroorotate dehydrogenase [Marinitoga sp. 38H-ov]|uniref:iron-sulfur cluster-binding protein n=1 Tax=Marinitoga sp. 38H-ov TaxID=1755814 RepID=UPI0013EBF8FE|nr:dihydroorotate dehydrogenase [Marinitoga sp. 38H-ov]KAF2956294.1 hypothetical protein AS160_06165 [Marinitoga sp. 38H-ov]